MPFNDGEYFIQLLPLFENIWFLKYKPKLNESIYYKMNVYSATNNNNSGVNTYRFIAQYLLITVNISYR